MPASQHDGFSLARRLRSGEPVMAAWISSGLPRVAEAVVSAGFDAALFDMQHGEGGFAEIRDAMAAVHLAGKPSGVRLPLADLANGARLLDLGAELVVLPMVDTAEEARLLVQATKYPPLGGRSYGPARAASLLGSDADTYRTTANEHVVVLAMIETRPAVEALEAILDIEGLDGVFIGPSDLSVSLSGGARNDHASPAVAEVKHRVVEGARARGKLTGIYCQGGEAAAQNAALGFNLLGVGSDWGFLAAGARAALQAARGQVGEHGPAY